ncbi:MAG TPA: hypothetical protein VNN55_10685 [bacterium]|nr:hypothetical protein [bacterium]
MAVFVAMSLWFGDSCLADTRAQRDTVAAWMTRNETLQLAPALAAVLADSMPVGILNEIMRYGPLTVHSSGRCIELPAVGNNTDSLTAAGGLSFCAFSGDNDLYCAAIRRQGDRAQIIWDTAVSGGSAPQPCLRWMRLGGKNDSGVTVVVSSVAAFGAGGAHGHVLVRWDGVAGKIVAWFDAAEFDTLDVDRDGIPEMRAANYDFRPWEDKRERIVSYYKLDRSTGVYKAMPVPADSAGKK